jgi:hypothetical protein
VRRARPAAAVAAIDSLWCARSAAALFVVSTLSVPALAEPIAEVRGRASTYRDSDHTTVDTLAARLSVMPIEALKVSGGYLADIVSSASVDVVSAATPSFDETRHEGDGQVAVTVDDLDVSASYRYSVENDWRSHTGVLGGTLKLADKSTELGLSLAFTSNEVGRNEDDNFSRRLLAYAYSARVGQVLDRSTYASLTYEGSFNDGFQSSPYRYVTTSDGRFTLLEHHPEERIRHAAALEVIRYLLPQTSARAGYRFYIDSWGLSGHTGELRLIRDLGSYFTISVRERFYFQRAASFYEPWYGAPRAYMSVDRELSTFWDSFTGGSLSFEMGAFGPFESIGADLAGDYFYFRFLDYPRLVSRTGVVLSAGLLGSF